jgi:hypothetical protein
MNTQQIAGKLKLSEPQVQQALRSGLRKLHEPRVLAFYSAKWLREADEQNPCRAWVRPGEIYRSRPSGAVACADRAG